jgi:flagellar biosynthesis/type III secretory pathway protein FliH
MKFRLFTIPAAALALALSATPAHAQWGRIFGQDRDDYYRGNARQIAYDNGYREGMDHGQQAARSNRPFNLEREKDYRNADEGYRREYGNKDRYRDDFRRGFAEGYRQAYGRYGYVGTNGYYGARPVPRDRDDVYRGGVYGGTVPTYGAYGTYGYAGNIAFNNGVNDGLQKGQEDARNGKSFDPVRQKWYRNGDRNYNDDTGMSRDQYRNEYRRGFQQGYDQGYRQYRRW